MRLSIYKSVVLSILTTGLTPFTLTNGECKKLQSMLSEEQKAQEGGLACVLVLNKVDLITNKRRMRNLESELHDLARFDHTFHISCTSGFGIESLREYLMDQALERPWQYDERMVSNKSPVE